MAVDVKVTWHGAEATARARQGGLLGLKMAAEFLLSEANKLVPLDEGTLERSGRATVDAELLEATVSYDTPYAVVQHENLEFHHPNGRQAKFLEKPWMEHASTFAEIIAAQVRRALGGGGR